MTKQLRALVMWTFFLMILFPLPVAVAQGQPSAAIPDAAPAVTSPSSSHPFDAEAGEDEFEEFEDTAATATADPLAGYNRFMTGFNDKMYVWVLRPVARGYRYVVMKPVRMAVSRVFTNAGYPVRFVNNLLQLKIRRAGVETGRFIVNTTLGVAGLFDPATNCMEMPAYPEDFGQTMGHYGLGAGWHVVLPFLGPSNVRDAVALVPDAFLNPAYYIEDNWTAVGVSALNRLNTLSLFMDDYDALRSEALDLYIFQRNAYEMKRKKEIEE